MMSAERAPSLPTAALNPCATPRISVGNSSDAWTATLHKHCGVPHQCLTSHAMKKAWLSYSTWPFAKLISPQCGLSPTCMAELSWVCLAEEVLAEGQRPEQQCAHH